ncbi:BON domain-containing protein [Paracandidimonas soli]|uniref:Osmotically-inducible protein OsmY n=1 Tax=Paracandidimonas soli TaxID=1917182 RepID=A0A4R3VGE5_9BURK|nr:BON domain-containing protein [Paracandidimonas soli]TCV02808.1 osmotically-inducible protein OsmY [Paracandidimonas soli]
MTSSVHPYRRRILASSLAIGGAVLLPGCAPLVVGGAAATTAVVATDRRTTGEQVEDQAIELKIGSEMRRLIPDNARINATSYAGVVLLTGDLPSEAHRQTAEQAASKVEKVKKVYNRLRVGDVTPVSVRSNDTWLTSKVRTALVNTKEVPSRTIVVTTERGVVYLMGRVTQAEAQRAGKVAAGIKGVNQVATLFEIVTAEYIASLSKENTSAPASASSQTTADPAANNAAPGSESVEIIPVQ